MNKLLVTGVGIGSVGEQVMKALRQSPISDKGFDLIASGYGADFDSVAKGVPYVQLPMADDSSYLERLVSLCREVGVVGIFPGSDQEISVLAGHEEELRCYDITVLANNQNCIAACQDKFLTGERLRQCGVQVPQSVLLTSTRVVERIDYFPVILKPNKGGRGSKDVFIAQDRQELRALCSYLRVFESSFLIQQYLGKPDSEYTVGTLSDQNGTLVDSIALRKDLSRSISVRHRVRNRTQRDSLSEELVVSSGISQGVIQDYPDVRREAGEAAKCLGSTGPLNIQGRVHEGSLYIFEVNPRFSGTTAIRAAAGFNEPELMVRERLLGESPPQNRTWKGLRATRHLTEEVSLF